MTRRPRTSLRTAAPRTARPRLAGTYIFVGPTLAAPEVVALLPNGRVLPPASVGDVLALARRRGVKRIAIIDGYFERMAAVWHKEILVALERGIEVYGAASMGAIRAAELQPFGMIGVGAIFDAFVRGAFGQGVRKGGVARFDGAAAALCADDEVAVAHLPAEFHYRPTSDALVNLRDGLARARRARAITAASEEVLVELARRRFYRERSWDQLVRDGRAAKVPSRQLAALDAWRAKARPDRKAEDARLLLRRLASASRKPATKRSRPGISVPRTWAFRQLERGVR